MANGQFQQAGNILGAVSAGLGGGGRGAQQFLQSRQQETDRQADRQRAIRGEEEARQKEQDLRRRETVFTDSFKALNFAEQGDFASVVILGQNRLRDSAQFPQADFSDTENLTKLAELAANGDKEAGTRLTSQLKTNVKLGEALGVFKGVGTSSEERAFAALTKGFTPEEVDQARRIKAGLAPRAIGTGAQTIAALGTAQEVGESEAVISGLKSGAAEGAKLAQRFKLEPQIAAAVQTATADITAAANAGKENRSNEKAREVFNVGMQALSTSLGETFTGGIFAVLPALTQNQRTADGAVAIMAPLLKQIFRVAGEGQFTDKDQELLLQMVPTRKDPIGTIQAKIGFINSVIDAKLRPTAPATIAGAQALAIPGATPPQTPAIAAPQAPTAPGFEGFSIVRP